MENDRVIPQKIKHRIMNVIQQFHFYVYNQKYWKQKLTQKSRNTHYSEKSNSENNPNVQQQMNW